MEVLSMRWGLCALALLTTSCPSTKKQTTDLSGLLTPQGGTLMIDDSQPGFTLKLGEGAPDSQRAERLPVAQATPLSEGEAQRVLARLPALAAKDGDVKGFALRD